LPNVNRFVYFKGLLFLMYKTERDLIAIIIQAVNKKTINKIENTETPNFYCPLPT